MDPSVALKTLISSARHWAQVFPSHPGPRFSPPAVVPNATPWVRHALIGRPLYGSRKMEASFADSRLNALALCPLSREP